MKVIVIGAGASGLMAAYELGRKNVEVLLLEQNDRIGGRIHTLVPPGFTNHVEAGAEFIHGNLPLTLQLMKKAKLSYNEVSGKMYRFQNGRMSSNFGESKAWNVFYSELQKLKKDCTLSEFLDRHFAAARYDQLRKEVLEMAQGLDLADPQKLSVLSIRQEWLSEETQYRPSAGYLPLLEFLRNEAVSPKYQLHLNEKVCKIEWKPNSVKVMTDIAGYVADAAIITVPLGNLLQQSIAFEPAIPEITNHFEAIGFGFVIKIAFEFNDIFWNEQYPDLGFLFAEGGFTFWSQLSEKRPVLMGWIGHEYTLKYHEFPDDTLKEMAMSRLSEVFGAVDVREKLKAAAVFRYDTNSESGGGYSWLKVNSNPSIRTINKGVANTIWFAGEALHPGAEVGTVEAALQSGRYTARKVIKLRK